MDVRGRAFMRCSRVCWYAGLPSMCGMRCLGVVVVWEEEPPAMRRGLMSFCVIAVCAFAFDYGRKSI